MRSIAITFLAASLTFSAAVPCFADAAAGEGAKGELTQFYIDLEKVLDSDTFSTDPTPALGFFDEKKIRLFDLTVPEQFDSKTFHDHFITTSKAVPSKTKFEDIQIHADGGKVAFVSYIQHSVGKMGPAGFDIRIRALDGLVKEGGKWRIVNESLSLPLDEQTLGGVLFPKPKSAAPKPAAP